MLELILAATLAILYGKWCVRLAERAMADEEIRRERVRRYGR